MSRLATNGSDQSPLDEEIMCLALGYNLVTPVFLFMLTARAESVTIDPGDPITLEVILKEQREDSWRKELL